MSMLQTQILELVALMPGLTDREITNRLRGTSEHQQPINQTARLLESKGLLIRRKRDDGLIGNYSSGKVVPQVEANLTLRTKNHDLDALSEDELKSVLEAWLESDGWHSEIAWGNARGIDIDARRKSDRWIIEVKGPGSRQPMRVNYFIGILGETLQRMDDPKAKYSIAFPDLPQYRGLWERLPALAKSRTKISMIFVTKDEKIEVLER
jgi:hypothetical protein